jgi:hypothetical protein
MASGCGSQIKSQRTCNLDQLLEWRPFRASRQYPRTCSLYPPRVSPRTLTAVHPSWLISLAKRRHAPAPRLRCGISKISNTVCVVMRSMPSSSNLPCTRSSRTRQGSASRAAISACTCSNLSSHDNPKFLIGPPFDQMLATTNTSVRREVLTCLITPCRNICLYPYI